MPGGYLWYIQISLILDLTIKFIIFAFLTFLRFGNFKEFAFFEINLLNLNTLEKYIKKHNNNYKI